MLRRVLRIFHDTVSACTNGHHSLHINPRVQTPCSWASFRLPRRVLRRPHLLNRSLAPRCRHTPDPSLDRHVAGAALAEPLVLILLLRTRRHEVSSWHQHKTSHTADESSSEHAGSL